MTDLTEADRTHLAALLAEKPKKDGKPEGANSFGSMLLWFVTSALFTMMVITLLFKFVFHIDLGREAWAFSAWRNGTQQVAPPLQVAQDAAQGAVERIRTVVQQYTAPATEPAEPPALRGPKPGVVWDGKANKYDRETAPREKAQPVEQPKLGKPIATAVPLVAQPVKPSGKAETGKQERQGKENP